MIRRRLVSVFSVITLLIGGIMLTVPGSVAGQPVQEQCFSETNRCIRGAFLKYWREHGGLAINGFPLTDPFNQRLEDGQEHVVQYFERVRMEEHPNNEPPYTILLGQFGRLIYLTESSLPQANSAPRLPDAIYFEETGHNVSRRFHAYWRENGGLAQFGYPISEEFRELLETGQTRSVQYFERARFEHHPELPAPFDVLLGQFGRRIIDAQDDNRLLPFIVSGGRGTLYRGDVAVRVRLQLPTGAEASVNGVIQPFERGTMIWREDQRKIYVLSQDKGYYQAIGSWFVFDDTWTEGQEPGGGPAPVPNLFLPKRGFGKVWRENPIVQQMLGYALAGDETIKTLVAQPFVGGTLMDVRDAPTQQDYRFSQGIYLFYSTGRFEFRYGFGP